MTPSKSKIAHLASNHLPFDTRIFLKECTTLAASGYDVVFIVPHEQSEVVNNIYIHAVKSPQNRKERLLKSAWRIFRAAHSHKAAIYHFHDLDLLPIGFLLKLLGYKVIHDIHEDYPRQILSKSWIHPKLRVVVARVIEFAETIGAYIFDGIIAATPTIAKRFPENKTTLLQNFPIVGELSRETPLTHDQRPMKIVYIGGMSAIRGVREMITALSLVPKHLNITLTIAGTFDSKTLENEVMNLPGWSSVEYLGHQTRSQVSDILAKSRAGLVLYHPEPNHINAQPNKLFEYMSAGIPVIASNFPLWREIVTDSKCGLLVNPLNPQEIANAIQTLLENPALGQKMGEYGMKAIKDKYSWEAEKPKLLTLYKKLVKD
jgi:glycosyltransferase involved in cell wall biosynthesis